MMGLNNFQIEFWSEDFGRFARQRKQRVHADAEVGGENNRQGFASLFNYAALPRRMTGRADDQWPSMLQCRAANPIDDIGVTEIDCDIAILHGRFDRVTQVTLRHDLDAWVRFGKIDNLFPIRPFAPTRERALEPFSLLQNPHPTLSLCKGEAILVAFLKFVSPGIVQPAVRLSLLGERI